MDKLRVGVLGLHRGVTHLHNFWRLDNAVVVGVADRIDSRRDKYAEGIKEHGGVPLREYDELLAMKPDAVVVASNGRRQCEHAVQALEAGCHVLSEVPGAFTVDEWIKIKDTVEQTGKHYMMAENTCFWDFFRFFRKWYTEDRWGPITLAEGEYVHYLPHTLQTPDGRSFTPSQAKEQGITDAVPTWRADQPPIQYLTHDLGPLLEVLDDRVTSVVCRSAPWRSKEAPLRSDGQYALFETAKGTLIRILVTLNTARPSEHRFRLFGTEGGAEWSLYEGFGRKFDRGRAESQGWERVEIGLAGKHDDTSTGHGGADAKVALHFTNALLEGRPPLIDVYRSIEYSLPGIIANQSALMGGAQLPIPDFRHEPYAGTDIWEHIGLPASDDEGMAYHTGWQE